MHVIFREQVGLEQSDAPYDPGQRPGDLVVLSFSDSDLGAFAEGWKRAAGGLPSLRLCNLVALRHPVSVDTYVENTLSGARGILIRLIGGEAYWPYGLASVQDLARRRGIALAVLPADGRDDLRLEEISTVPPSVLRVLRRHCDQGGAVAAQAALAQMAVASGLQAAPVPGVKTLPAMGLLHDPDRGVVDAGRARTGAGHLLSQLAGGGGCGAHRRADPGVADAGASRRWASLPRRSRRRAWATGWSMPCRASLRWS